METPRWVTFSDQYLDSYRRFAEEQYGRGCYQGLKEYLDWLYRWNPSAIGYDDFLVGVIGESEVVGCIHRMRLPWLIDGKECFCPTLHNLAVRPEYRFGTGFWLLKKSLHLQEHALIPGVVPPLSEAYRHMQCQPVPSRWFRRVTKKFSGALTLGLSRATGGVLQPRRYFGTEVREVEGCRLTMDPGCDQLERLAASLNRSAMRDQVRWDRELVKWRFFHRPGPRHALVESAGDPEAQAVVSLGPRSGVTVGRIVVLVEAWIRMGTPGIQTLSRILRRNGAHVVLAMTTRDDVASLLAQARFAEYPTQPETYLFHRDRRFTQQSVVGSEMTDIGLESIPAGGRAGGRRG